MTFFLLASEIKLAQRSTHLTAYIWLLQVTLITSVYISLRTYLRHFDFDLLLNDYIAIRCNAFIKQQALLHMIVQM